MTQLTKTDFIQYLNCPKSLWWLKHDPESYPHGEFSVFLQKLTREGYEVERYVRQLFEKDDGRAVNFQTVFETDDGLFARADALEHTDDGEAILYEIKSSTSVKTDNAHNHIKDACFQKICAERAGQKIDRVYLVHLNGKYVLDGEIDPAALLEFADVTDQVGEMADATKAEIEAALTLLRVVELDRNGCSCLRKSRANHCDTFSLLNPGIPVPSIYSLPRLSQKKRDELITNGIFDLPGVPEDYPLSANQEIVLLAAKAGAAQINFAEIQGFFEGFLYPFYFLDFETYGSAVPLMDRASPHKQFPVQYSLHILGAGGTLTHKEFLEREARLPDRLIDQMQADIGPEGSVVSWHASFEKTQNREMGKWFPDKAAFLNDLNDRMVDLEDLFKTAYVDARFNGSTSIKKVLPVICPELGYKDLEVQDGSLAMAAWERLIAAKGKEADQIANDLLRYCERDTLAMVEIYRFLAELAAN
jgi:CRISPR/Cas system-associated exonuclease Cas4 (RecB family)